MMPGADKGNRSHRYCLGFESGAPSPPDTKNPAWQRGCSYLAEREGFEPPEGYKPSTVFKTAAFDRSATSPLTCHQTVASTALRRAALAGPREGGIDCALSRWPSASLRVVPAALRPAHRARLAPRFEPPEGYKPSTVFKTAAFDRSATSPLTCHQTVASTALRRAALAGPREGGIDCALSRWPSASLRVVPAALRPAHRARLAPRFEPPEGYKPSTVFKTAALTVRLRRLPGYAGLLRIELAALGSTALPPLLSRTW